MRKQYRGTVMRKNYGRFLIGGALAATGALAITAYTHTSKYLMKLALDREGPRNMEKEKEKMLSDGDFSKAFKILEAAGQKLARCDTEEVEITAHDGITLAGHWYSPKSPKRVIVAMHGWRSSWSQDFGLIAPFWHENDCAVLYAEQRGQGNSGGKYMGFGLLERHDCLDWIDFVNERTFGTLTIYLGGISMGATTVLMAGGFELPENVLGIVADCAFTSPHAIWKHVVESNFHLPFGVYRLAADDLCKRKINVAANSYSTMEALSNCKVPVLFIHGTDDTFVPIEMTYENYKVCQAPKKLLAVPGAEHGMSYLVDEKSYQKAVTEFWRDCEN